MMEVFDFCQCSADLSNGGGLICCNRKQTLSILFKATALHHGRHKQGWKIHKMKWNQILHRAFFFDLWFKAMDEFACSTSYLYFYLCGMLSDPELGQLPWFN